MEAGINKGYQITTTHEGMLLAPRMFPGAKGPQGGV